jgi:isoleucyl-tRNA synthetase
MHEILVTVVKLMAPVLSFTADEVWRYVPMRDKPASVHLTEFPAARPILLDESLAGEWERLLQVRDEVLRALEAARKDKRIGSAQEAAVELAVPAASFDFLAAHQEDLETICIVSRLAVRRSADGGADRAIVVRVERAPGAKCPRCWNYRENVGASAAHPSLCERCAGAIEGRG